MAKKIPLRQCVGCGEMKEKKQLIRVLRGEDGSFSLDATGRKNGRGAYICREASCLESACKKKGLERSFKTPIPEAVYNSLREEFEAIHADE